MRDGGARDGGAWDDGASDGGARDGSVSYGDSKDGNLRGWRRKETVHGWKTAARSRRTALGRHEEGRRTDTARNAERPMR